MKTLIRSKLNLINNNNNNKQMNLMYKKNPLVPRNKKMTS